LASTLSGIERMTEMHGEALCRQLYPSLGSPLDDDDDDDDDDGLREPPPCILCAFIGSVASVILIVVYVL